MTTASNDLGRLLAELLECAPAPGEGDPGEVRTLDVLHRLSLRRSEPLAPDDRTALEMLCRKVAVAGRVWEAYEPGWKRPASRAPLTGPGYALLGAVLIAYASPPETDAQEPGLALKFLNAAFGALDLARQCGDAPLLPELDESADRNLAQLLPHP